MIASRVHTLPRSSVSSTSPRGFVKSFKPFYSPWLHDELKSVTQRANSRNETLSFPLLFVYLDSISPFDSLSCLNLDSANLHISLSLGIASGTRCSPVNWPTPRRQHATEPQLRLLVPQILNLLRCIPMSAEHFSCLVSMGLISVTACIIESPGRSLLRHRTARWAYSHTVCGPSWQVVLRL